MNRDKRATQICKMIIIMEIVIRIWYVIMMQVRSGVCNSIITIVSDYCRNTYQLLPFTHFIISLHIAVLK